VVTYRVSTARHLLSCVALIRHEGGRSIKVLVARRLLPFMAELAHQRPDLPVDLGALGRRFAERPGRAVSEG
jgi:hypothetical protein